MHPIFLSVLVPTACLAGSMIMTWALRQFARSRCLLDHPNERSAHAHPKPRLGGAGIMSSFLLGATALGLTMGGLTTQRVAALGGASAMTVLGLIDDLRPLSARVRFLTQAIIASTCVGFMRENLVWALGPWARSVPTFALMLLVILGVLWMTNLFNFMDGIDGLAAGQTIAVALAIAIVAWCAGSTLTATTALCLAAAAAGFLVFNYPPSSIFMGDAGSTAIGFTLAVTPFTEGEQCVPAPVILLAGSPFILDATTTLLLRILRGERWLDAHRTHYYQRPLACGVSHRQISHTAYVAMLICALAAIGYAREVGLARWTYAAIPIAVFTGITVAIKNLEATTQRTVAWNR